MYHVRILDRDRQIQAILPDVQWSYTRRINQATEISVTIPREVVDETIDPEHPLYDFFARPDKGQYAEIAAFVQVYQGTQLKASGCITGRELGQTITVKALTEEILLEQIITPAQYGRVWDGWDLADVARDLLDGWQSIRVKDQSQWQSYMVGSSNIDLTTEPGVAMLAKDGTGKYYSSGYITLLFDSGEISDFKQWDRVRWSADSNEIVSTSIQVSYDGSSWSEETDGGLPEEIGYYLGGSQGQVWVRINLRTTDTESEDPDGNPIGVTPYVFACELIGRTEGHLAEGSIPSVAGVTVKGLDADHANALEVLVAACEQNGWEFAVWNGGLSIAEALGANRVAEFVLRTGTNMEVTSLGDDDSELCNILTAYGPGQGLNRLEITLRDDESIGAYGDYPRAMEFDVSSLTELEQAAQNYLDTHNTPKTHFAIRAAFDCDAEPDYGLGDVVRVADPDTGIVTTTRIMTESREYSDSGLSVRLDLGRARLNLQSVLDGRERLPKPVDPLTPTGVYARGVFKGLVVGCSAPKLADWSVTECHISTAKGFEPGSATLADSGKRTRFDIPNLAPGVRYYARLIHVDTDGRRSEPSREVSAVTLYIHVEDLDQAPPDTPVWDTCDFVRSIVLRWHPAARAAEYEIRESDSGWGEVAGRVWMGNATTVTLTPTQRSHTYYIRAISAAGVYSLDAATITLTNDTPSTPPQPTVQEFFSCLWITINPVADNDIVSYKLYVTPVDDGGNPIGSTETTTYMNAGRVTYNASPGSRFKVEVAASDVLGEGAKSTPVYARTRKIEGVADFAQELIPPRIVNELPALPDPEYPEGSLVVLTTNHVLYRCTGDSWDASVNVDMIVGQIQAGMIAAGAIGAEEIAAGEILADHFAAGSIEAYVAAVQEAFIDSAKIISVEADKITVGGSAPGIPLMKPEGAKLWHFDGSLVSTDGISPVGTPVATLRPDGRFGGCVAVEVGTTNLVSDPANWMPDTDQYQTTTVTDETFLGCKVSETVKLTSSTPPSTVSKPTIQPGETYTASIYVKLFDLHGGNAARLIFYDGGVLKTVVADSSVLGEWQRLTVTYTNNTEQAITPFVLYYPAVAEGAITRQAAPQIEKLPYATSFTVGTRARGKLEHEVTYGDRGTLRWLMTGSSRPDSTTAILDFNPGGTTRNDIWQQSSAYTAEPCVRWYNAGDGSWLYCYLAFDPNDWLDCVVTWNKTTKLRTLTVHNLTKGVSNSVSANDADTLVFADKLLYGYGAGGPYSADVRYDEVMLWNHAATPEQVQAWHNMGAPFHDPQERIGDERIPSASRWDAGIAETLSELADLSSEVSAKVTIFYQPDQPTAKAIGDIWYDTDADPVAIHRWNGSQWIDITTTALSAALDAAGDAQATADGKIKTYYQASAPTTGMSVGDLWVDTDDGNRLYRYSGTQWVDVADKTPINADQRQISAVGGKYLITQDGATQYDGSGVKRVHMGHLAGLEWKGQQLPQGTYGFWAPDGRIAVSNSQVYQVDDETGTSTTSADYVDVPGMELNLTVSESVLCLLQCSFTGGVVSGSYSHVAANFRLTSNGSEIPATMRRIRVGPFGGGGGGHVNVPVAMNTILTLTPGTYSIKLQFKFIPMDVFQESEVRVFHRTLSALVLRC